MNTHNLGLERKSVKTAYPCTPQFYNVKVLVKWLYISRTCYPDVYNSKFCHGKDNLQDDVKPQTSQSHIFTHSQISDGTFTSAKSSAQKLSGKSSHGTRSSLESRRIRQVDRNLYRRPSSESSQLLVSFDSLLSWPVLSCSGFTCLKFLV